MAMSLFCYSTGSIEFVEKIINSIIDENKDIFLDKFLISKPRETGGIQKEIALEHGLSANSIFLIRYNDKMAVNLSPDVVDIIKAAFGFNNILILFENEVLR
ncbi:MAG: hypothetical protein ACRCSI_08785 [Eubacterium aggregans]